MPEDSEFCMTASNDDLLGTFVQMKNVPNPTQGFTQIQLNSTITSELDFQVFDLLGKEVHRQQVQIFEGANNFEFDGSRLSDGIYIYSVSNQDGRLSNKMIINRN